MRSREIAALAGSKLAWSVGAIGVISCIPFLLCTQVQAETGDMLIDDFVTRDLVSRLGTQWRGFSDRVMGGISRAAVSHDMIDGRPCLRLNGTVRLENSGGFIQAALDLVQAGGTVDVSGYAGVRLVARGNDEKYSVHLRTPDNVRPWQSYRAQFVAQSNWRTIELPFEAFSPHRPDAPLDRTRLRRIGLVAIGRAFTADLAVSELSFYRFADFRIGADGEALRH